MRIFEEDEPEESAAGRRAVPGSGRAVEPPAADDSRSPFEPARAVPAPGRSAGIWILFLADLLLAGSAVGAVFFLRGAETYLTNDSAEFGSELTSALYGVWVLRIASYVLAGGFVIAALGVISLTRLGWRVQCLWAVLLCLTIVGLPYGGPALFFLGRRSTRSRFFDSP